MTTVDALRRAVLTTESRNAVNKVVNRLCRAGLLTKYPLVHPVRYFVLGDTAARQLGCGGYRANPLGPQILPVEFGVLCFATLGRQLHLRLTRSELFSRLGWMSERLADLPHTVDRAGVLELVRVDLGGPSDHVARKCVADINQRRMLQPFNELCADGGFRLVVVTGTARKAEAIRRSLDQKDWPSGLQIHLSVVPQLLSFTVRSSDA